ncbi:MAG TPA: mannose-1-phosphate guanylyltransferase [Polyangia bacterium]|nr:mannose-1-phosphate guanylyltransferase [Polyangia bacterium]
MSSPRAPSPARAFAAFAVILAGGGGTRLWPSSRRARPKQLLTLGGAESLLAAAVRRAQAVVGLEHTLVVTAADQEAQVRAAVPDLPAANVIAEPVPRNTAPAVGLGAVAAARRAGLDAVIAVLPADPFIGDEPEYERLLRAALAEGREAIVTIGITPTHAETGFGYLRLGPPSGARPHGARVHDVAAFVEKPNLARAEEYVASKDYLWNSGMFFLTARRMFEEARRHLPALADVLDAAVAARDDAAAAAVVRARYAGTPSISIDNGIMEKAGGLRVLPGAFGWNDVGSWAAVATIRPADEQGNVVLGGATVVDSEGSLVIADEGAPFVGVVGVKDLVVVVTKDAVLVVPKALAQDVKKIVEAAKKSGRHDLL